jgi:pyrroline-5-carboxylate reductase
MLVVGGGRMGEAIIGGLVRSAALSLGRIVVAEPSARRRDDLCAAYPGLTCVASAADSCAGAEIVLLAVKPQVIEDVACELSGCSAGTLIISIAAGVTCARLESMLPGGVAVVRVMPNTPALVGQGMSVISGGSEADAASVTLVESLFSAVGETVVVPERYQDAATAISGCGPAYMAIIIDALARAGVRHGLTREVGQALAIQTMRGTAALLEETGMHPEELVDGVTSPGGATIAAVEALEALGLRAALAEAVTAAVERAKELGS